LATALRSRYRYERADAIYRQLLAHPAGRVEDIGRQAALGLGLGQLVRWVPDSAAAMLQRAAAEARATGDAMTEGEALAALSGVLNRRGQGDSARVVLARAGELVPPTSSMGIQRLCTQALGLRGTSLAAADSVVRRGVALARASADTVALARCLLSQGIVLEGRGLQRASADAMNESLMLASAILDIDLLANVEQWQAYATATYGSDFSAARRYAERAIVHATETRNPVTAAWARLNLSQVALRVGDAARAYRSAQDALQEFQRLGEVPGQTSVLVVQAQAAVLGGRLADGIVRYARVESLFTASGLASAAPVQTLRRAMAYADLGDVARAQQLIDSAQGIARRANLRGVLQGSLPYAQGRVDLRRGAYDAAVANFERFKAAVGPAAAHAQLDADVRIAEALALQGRFTRAESLFTRGTASLDKLRERLREREDMVSLLSGMRYDADPDLGLATIVNRLAVGGRIETAFSIAESERARWLWMQRSRRQAMRGGEQGASELDDRMLALDEVRERLDERTAIVAFVVGRWGELTTGFSIWRGGVRAFSLTPIDSLTRDIDRFGLLLQEGGAVASVARSLGQRLLDSALAVLPAAVTHLRIVPDGQLYHVPFDALALANGRLLLDRYVTSTSASVRLAVSSTPTQRGGRLVAFGDAVFDARHGLPRLQGSGEEVNAILRVVGDRGTARLRQAASAQALQDMARQGASVLHLATHARVQDYGLLDNAFYLSGSASSDGRVGAEDLAGSSLPVDLVVLSACRTVGGFVATGEGVQGLVAPILEAGAHAVVVTNWDVRDRSLIRIMEDFYRGLMRGAPAGDALTLAKRASRTRGDRSTTWASLAVIGDAQVRPLVREGARGAGLSPSAVPFHRGAAH
jgi:tetratricopeptide (TPR) repeat protein